MTFFAFKKRLSRFLTTSSLFHTRLTSSSASFPFAVTRMKCYPGDPCVYQNMFLMAAFFFCYPANPKSKLTKFKLQKNHNMTQQYSKCHQEVAKNMCITKSSNTQSSSTLKVTIYNHFKICFKPFNSQI